MPHLGIVFGQSPELLVGVMGLFLGGEACLSVELHFKQLVALGESPPCVYPFVLVVLPRIPEIRSLKARILHPPAVTVDARRVTLIGVAERVPDRVLDHAEGFFNTMATLFDGFHDLLFNAVPLLEPVLKPRQVPFRILGLNPAHGRRDRLALDPLHPGAPLVNGVGAVDGLNLAPVPKSPLHPDLRARTTRLIMVARPPVIAIRVALSRQLTIMALRRVPGSGITGQRFTGQRFTGLGITGLGITGLGITGLGITGQSVMRLGVMRLGVAGQGVAGVGVVALVRPVDPHRPHPRYAPNVDPSPNANGW